MEKSGEKRFSGNFEACGYPNFRLWWTVFTMLLLASVITRFYSLDQPNHVCWDETHFGKFAGFYINRTLFFDVHPPLGKMLIALFGYLDGYNATFPFSKPGDKYMDYPYLGMRTGCAAMGACVVPLCFLIVWEMTFSLPAAMFAGIFILLDNGMVTISRYILLDPLLLFFISASAYTLFKFHNKDNKAFTASWWFWLVATGVMLAGAASVKFVGIFVSLFVGLRTLTGLWDVFGDSSRPISYTLKHFLARVMCLIILPISLYMAIFYVHLQILHHSGPSDSLFSSAFQIHLMGNPLHNATAPRDVAYGSLLRIRNVKGGYLHSHTHLYPAGVGAKQQQVASHRARQQNNRWFVKTVDQPLLLPLEKNTDSTMVVRNGDLIRLEHLTTKKNLHSHKEPAPESRHHFQVTGYGINGTGDSNDFWRLVIQEETEKEVLQIMRHKFRLMHFRLKCVLTTTAKTLPKWGFELNEVTCNPNLHDPAAVWYIEGNVNPQCDEYLNLLQRKRFIETHTVMFEKNAALKPKEGAFSSRPWMWPIDYKGQVFSGRNDFYVYLLGNPVIWWGNLFFMGLYLLLRLIRTAFDKRSWPIPPRQYALQDRVFPACDWLFIGWLLHYVPFWGMDRVLYFHHYFSALIFSSMISGVKPGNSTICYRSGPA